ncbi:MAG TPA: class I SAM-dependent methyltransferase, partial [Pseudonocardia sp.]
MSTRRQAGAGAGSVRVRSLLDPARLDHDPDDTAGYLDVLGDTDAGDGEGLLSLAQRAMRNGVLASVYERWWRPTFTLALGLGSMGQEARNAVRELGLGGGEQRVLDVACGPGNLTRVFAEAVRGDGFVVGLDASRPMLERAVLDNSVSRAGYLRADARALPFPDGSFDAVCCYAALYLVPDPFTVLAEMLRVLAPGGR